MELGTTTGRAKIGNQKSNFRNGNEHKDREGQKQHIENQIFTYQNDGKRPREQKQFFENLFFS